MSALNSFAEALVANVGGPGAAIVMGLLGGLAGLLLLVPFWMALELVAALQDRARQGRVVSSEEGRRLIAEAVARRDALGRREGIWSK